MNHRLLIKTALAAALAVPFMASAESNVDSGAGATAAADLNFRVIIPRVIFLAVGSGAASVNLNPATQNTTVNEVGFDFTSNPQDVGSGAAAGAVTSNGGTVVGASARVPVRVFGNVGNIQIERTNAANLTDGALQIPFTEIAASSVNGNIPVPTFGGAATVTVAATAGIVNANDTWAFEFGNNNDVAAGNYVGTVTYTATAAP